MIIYLYKSCRCNSIHPNWIRDGSEFKACAECTEKCLLVHGNKRNASPVITTFVRVMFGLYEYASNCEAEYAEEMCDTINREYGDKQGENRAHILDLYDYEMPKKTKTSRSEGSNKMAVVNVTCCHNADSSLILRNEASSVKDPVVKEVATTVIPLDGSEFERTLKNNYCEVKVKKGRTF